MRLHLQFDVDNAAYRDDTDALLCDEVAVTVRAAAEIIEQHGTLTQPIIRNASWPIFDHHGNTVGRWTFVDDSDTKEEDETND